jgi:hypothetical protein
VFLTDKILKLLARLAIPINRTVGVEIEPLDKKH